VTRKFSEQELARGREVPALEVAGIPIPMRRLEQGEKIVYLPINPLPAVTWRQIEENALELVASYILPQHLIAQEPRSITATEVLARMEERTSPENRKRRTPFNERFYIERAGHRVIARWYDGEFMFNGEYLDTIGLDGV